jgi:hypothetical protein
MIDEMRKWLGRMALNPALPKQLIFKEIDLDFPKRNL